MPWSWMSQKRVWIDHVLSLWASRVFATQKLKGTIPLGPLGEMQLDFFLSRFSFSLFIWLTGLLAYAFDGLVLLYLSDLQTYGMLLGIAPLAFLGAGGLYYWLKWFFTFVRPMIALDDAGFEKFRDRLERVAFSFLPCLLLGMIFFFVRTNASAELELLLASGLKLHAAWHFAFIFFSWLIIGTGVWVVVSMWLAILSMSRQPLSLRLQPETFEKLRSLAVASLVFSPFYFVGLSISLFLPPPGVRTVEPIQISVAAYSFFALVGVIGILLPFDNIHKVLVGLKREELRKMGEDERLLLQELDNALQETQDSATTERKTRIVAITARLVGLQARERGLRGKDWPIDISFLSKLAGMGLIPLILELVRRVFLS